MIRALGRGGALLALLACLLVAACADGDRGSDRDRHGGVYGGVFGGVSLP
jgi:hypothetical protein